MSTVRLPAPPGIMLTPFRSAKRLEEAEGGGGEQSSSPAPLADVLGFRSPLATAVAGRCGPTPGSVPAGLVALLLEARRRSAALADLLSGSSRSESWLLSGGRRSSPQLAECLRLWTWSPGGFTVEREEAAGMLTLLRVAAMRSVTRSAKDCWELLSWGPLERALRTARRSAGEGGSSSWKSALRPGRSKMEVSSTWKVRGTTLREERRSPEGAGDAEGDAEGEADADEGSPSRKPRGAFLRTPLSLSIVEDLALPRTLEPSERLLRREAPPGASCSRACTSCTLLGGRWS